MDINNSTAARVTSPSESLAAGMALSSNPAMARPLYSMLVPSAPSIHYPYLPMHTAMYTTAAGTPPLLRHPYPPHNVYEIINRPNHPGTTIPLSPYDYSTRTAAAVASLRRTMPRECRTPAGTFLASRAGVPMSSFPEGSVNERMAALHGSRVMPPPPDPTIARARPAPTQVASLRTPRVAARRRGERPRARSRRQAPPAARPVFMQSDLNENERMTAQNNGVTVPVVMPAAQVNHEMSDRKRPASELVVKLPPAMPSGKTTEPFKEENEDDQCCICLDEPSHFEIASVNGCSHLFCFSCIEKWADRENTCPLCKARFTKIDRVNKPPPTKRRRKGEPPRAKGTKKVKNRDQRAEITGSNPVQGLFATIEANGSVPPSIAQLIFPGLNVTQSGLMISPNSNSRPSRVTSLPTDNTSVLHHSVPVSQRLHALSGNASIAASRQHLERMLVHPEMYLRAPSSQRSFPSVFDEDGDGDSDSEYFMQRVQSLSRGSQRGSNRSGSPNMGPGGRNYASNSHDMDAGGTANNALEIQDSDEENLFDGLMA